MNVTYPRAETTEPVMPNWRDVAASAYRAYAANLNGCTVRWERLPEEFKAAWEAAVRQASYVLREGETALGIEGRWAGWVPMPDSCECN